MALSGTGFRVLVVSGDFLRRELISVILRSRGVNASDVETPQTAIERLSQGSFETVMLDVPSFPAEEIEPLRAYLETNAWIRLVAMANAKNGVMSNLGLKNRAWIILDPSIDNEEIENVFDQLSGNADETKQ